jgi:cytochrome c2
MRNYFINARGRHWLLITILLAVSAYLPYLIFGAYPIAKRVNLEQDQIEAIIEDLDLPNYYELYENESTDAEKLLEKQAFDGWEGGKCRFCHAVREDDRDRMAPSLYKILGRPAGVSGNFKYSNALINMRENGLIWTPETIDAFISDPENYVPGNRMRVEGIKDPKTRELIINYLIRESK